MPDFEYPKAAYRLGGELDIWGRKMSMRHLVDREDEASALRDGWALHPSDIGDEPPLIAEVIAEQPKPRRGRPPRVETGQ